jgi:hypothetical protein
MAINPAKVTDFDVAESLEKQDNHRNQYPEVVGQDKFPKIAVEKAVHQGSSAALSLNHRGKYSLKVK